MGIINFLKLDTKFRSMPKKSKKGPKVEAEPIDDLTEMAQTDLQKELFGLRDRNFDLKSKRNYTQMERDMIEQFYKNTGIENEDFKNKIVLKENVMQKMEEDHRAEIKVYLQKVKHLEFDKSENEKQVQEDGELKRKKEEDQHASRIHNLHEQKKQAKDDFNKMEEENETEVENKKELYEKTLQVIKDANGRKLEEAKQKYEGQLKKLREDLELKQKVEIHEIEERKNQHINDLMRNHDEAFSGLKNFYNDITSENLNLIRAQKAEITKIEELRAANIKKIAKLRQENADLQKPLDDATAERDELKDVLKQFEKDRMSLSNLRIKLVALREKYNTLVKDKRGLDAKYESTLAQKTDLENRFDMIADEMKRNTEIQNIILIQKLEQQEIELDAKEAQLQEIIISSNLDAHYVNEITSKMRESLEEKNNEIKNLKYLIHHATKAYNDAIRVYEAKLVEFGIPPEELGFQPLESITSTMPAGLVSS